MPLSIETSWAGKFFWSPLGQVACYGWMSWQMLSAKGTAGVGVLYVRLLVSK